MSVKYETIDGPMAEKMDKMFGVKGSFLRVQPGNCLLPPQYVLLGKRIKDMEIRNDDVWMVSYPRTGSHWAQEMVWCIGNDFNYASSETLLVERNPLLEASAVMVTGNYVEWFKKLGDSVELVENKPSPRYIKSHLPWDLLPKQIHEKKPKLIYVTRNPKDTCVSFYHYCKVFHNMTGTFEDFAELFLTDNAPVGSFWSHVLKFWESRHQDNILFLMYEDMKRDQSAAIRKTAEFLGKSVTEEQIAGLCEHLKFSKMAANPAINLQHILRQRGINGDDPDNKFIRKGKVGDWRNYMNKDLAQRFDKWTEKNLQGSTLEFNLEVPCEAE